jgi:hypothetical protein
MTVVAAQERSSQAAKPSSQQPPQPRLRPASPSGLLSGLSIEHGPRDLLGRFFLQADTAARERGVYLSFGTFEELVEANANNTSSWHPLIPLFNPKNGGFSDHNAFCILGRNAQGEIVATQAARLYDWRDTSFYEEAKSLRLFYEDPARLKQPTERCEISAESTKFVSGKVCFSGGGWYRRDYRKKELSTILPRVSRALAFTRWDSDYTISIMAEKVIAGGMAERCGYTNVDWDLNLYDSPVGTVRCAFVWMERQQLRTDLGAFSAGLGSGTQVDTGVDERRA